MHRTFTRLGFTAAVLVAGSGIIARAQTATTGGLSGTVSDKNGAALAGATVRLSSSQTSRTFLTGTDGSFRLGLLNPGTWTVEVTKAGFQKITQTITVLVNQTQPVTFKMASEAATVVEVLGTTTTVDTTTTQTGLTTTMDNLAAIPKGRDMSSVAFLAPGVVASGFAGRDDPSIGGGSGAENSYIVDGLSTTNTSRGFQGTQLVTDFIDQVEVQTGGFKPEFSALGGVFNAVTKSGSNELKGSAWLTWDAVGIQAVPKQTLLAKQGNPDSRYDVGVELGGPIIKDKLFFFVGLDSNLREAPSSLANNTGEVDGKRKVNALQALAKINWMITQDHQLTFTANINDTKDDFPTRFPVTGNGNIGYNQKDTVQNFGLNYDWTISPSLFFSAKAGRTEFKTVFSPSDSTSVAVTDNIYFTAGPGSTTPPDPPSPLAGLPFRSGGAGYYAGLDKVTTTQYRGDLSWFLGDHNMKFGISQTTSDYNEKAATSGGERITIRSSGGAFNGIDRQFLSTDATVQAIFQAIYAQDTWDIGKGVKLMFGFRYEIQDQKDLNGKSFMKFDDFKDYVQPRLGFTWDVNEDGKTKVSGSYAKYFEQIPQRLAIRVYANEVYTRYRYGASNSSYNPATGAYAYGTVDPTNYRLTDFATPFSFDPIAEGTKLPERNEFTLGIDHTFASGWTLGIHAKYRELKNPLEDMVFTDNAGAPYDEGPAIDYVGTPDRYGAGAAVIGNPGAYQQWRPNPASLTHYFLGLGAANPYGQGNNSWLIYIPDYYNPATGLFTVHNTGYEKAGNKYSSVDLTLDKKTDRQVFSFSYTWSRLEGNYEGVVSSSNGQADGNITASFDYYPYVGYGLLPLDRTHVVKLFASHRFDVFGGDLSLGAAWTYQSGTPISLFDDGSSSNGFAPGYDTINNLGNGTVMSAPGAATSWTGGLDPNGVGVGTYIGPTHPFLDIGGYGNATPANGQLGQYGRTPAVNNVDMHIDWAYKFSKKFKLTPSIDIFNLFNSRTATGVFQQGTDAGGNLITNWGQANNWQIGRRYRFGVKFQF